MKIKEVVELTSLTSRTIRLYFEEKLIFPEYSENYLGRKSFNFSPKDVEDLKNISALRKHGFSIEEIREIKSDRECSSSIIHNRCMQKSNTIRDEQSSLSVLARLDDGRSYCVEEIAHALNSFSEVQQLPENDTMPQLLLFLKNPKKYWYQCLHFIDKIFFLLSLACAIFYILYFFFEYKYPHIYEIKIGFIFLSIICLPAIAVLSIGVAFRIVEYTTKKSILGAGIFSSSVVALALLPYCFLMILRPVESLTTDIKHYLQIDEKVTVLHGDYFSWELLPLKPGGGVRKFGEWTYPDAKYYYRYRAAIDGTTDIYAEWSLKEEAYDKEVERVTRLYRGYEIVDGEYGMNYSIVEKGNYTCLIRAYDNSPIFQAPEDNYKYQIFAYDRDNLRVRYIVCESLENGADQPYFLELEW